MSNGAVEFPLAEKYAGSYAPAKMRLSQCKQELDNLERICALLPDCKEKNVALAGIEKRKKQRELDRATVVVFELALMALEGQEKEVIIQLYVQRKRWTDIVSSDGYPLGKSSISRLRKKGLHHMESTIHDFLTEGVN